jgi:hypothetical protein
MFPGSKRFLLSVAALAGWLVSLTATATVLVGPFAPGSGRWTTVSNGGLESAPKALPVISTYTLTGDWHLFNSIGSSGTAAYSTEAAYQGQTGVRIQPTSTYTGPGIALTLGQLVPVQAGKPYVLSGFIRRLNPQGSKSAILLDLWGVPGEILIYSEAVPGWQFVYGTFTPSGPTVGIRATNGGPTGPSDAWDVDELAITPAADFVPPTPLPLKGILTGPFVPDSGHWTTVSNGGLESVPKPLPVISTYTLTGDWHLFNSIGSSGTAAYTTEAAYEGQTGVRIQPTSTYTGPGIALTLGQLVPVQAGKPYVLSGFIRRLNPQGSKSAILFDLWGAAGDILLYSDPVPGWQFVYGTFTPGGPTVGIRATNGGPTGPSDVWDVDELAITPAAEFRLPLQAPAPAGPRLLNLNFGINATPARSGPAAIGLTPTDVWNLYSRDDGRGGYRYGGPLSQLRWSDGTPSPIGGTVENAAGAWGNGHPDLMFGIYLYPLSGQPNITVTLTNVPAGRYRVLAYGHGGPPNDQNTVFNLRVGGRDYGDAATAADASWAAAEWTEGKQYVTFSNILVGPSTPLILTAKPGATPYACLNGLQLIQEGLETLAISPAAGFFTNVVTVQLFGAGGDVRYTLDGTEPTAASPLYEAPLTVRNSTTVRAQVFANGSPVGAGLTAEYLRVYALNDGISATWREQYFGAGYRTDPRGAADADPDNDGANNAQEFANGTHPLNPLSGFAVEVRLIPSITWNSVSNVTYKVLRKDRLISPDWIEIQRLRAFGNRTTFSDESAAEVPRYYLIEAIPSAP